ncbi:IS607 family element RNA-guided endonuclease TnpB [soil metagenome]
MSRHTAFRFCLDPTTKQSEALDRHAGAARFAFNQCLRFVKSALTQRATDHDLNVPWSNFDLISAFNQWKTSEAAGRVLAVNNSGEIDIQTTGLAWRHEVCQQVFEEAAVDLSRGLAAWSSSRSGLRKGKRVGFPRFKKKSATMPSFRVRNKHRAGRKSAIRVGDNKRHRTVTLPGIGQIRVHDNTRRLRRMISSGGAKILSANVSHVAGRWWVSLTVEARDLHLAQRHPVRDVSDSTGWVGVDRGLTNYLVAATSEGEEVSRVDDPPKALAAGLKQQRRLAKSLARKQKGSKNRRDAAARLGRHSRHVANIRRHFLHQISNELVKTHDRLVIEDLNVAGMLANHRLARSISDAGWSEFARFLRYKQQWRGGTLVVADRWYPSSKRCSQCDAVRDALALADRVFNCHCGLSADRDFNAAVNLAHWGQANAISPTDPRTPKRGGRATNARRRGGTDLHTCGAGETTPAEAGTEVQAASAG